MEHGTKERQTYYTPDRVAAARRNVERHEWARGRADEAIDEAERILDRGMEVLWMAIPGQRIPRAGLAGDGNGRETWTPVEGVPWTVTDGEWTLPTNDFEAYRESGRDERGFFDPELADDSLLVNEAHPEMGETWGVDDGTGFLDEDGDIAEPGTVLTPVAFYNHFYQWYALWDDLNALRDAFLYTGEQRFARAGAVLLDRVADEYPWMNIGEFSVDRFFNSHGGTGAGKIVGSIWETNLVRDLVSAYDAFFPAFDDPDLVAFLDGRSQEYSELPEKSSAAAIRGNVERGIVREVLPAVEQAQIRGNLGMHQAALAMAAVVMDEPDGYTADAVEFLYRPAELRTVEGTPFRKVEGETTDRVWTLTGGNLSSALVELLDRDGYGHEAAPNYNLIVRNQLARVADILDQYDPGEASETAGVDAEHRLDAEQLDLYANPKLRRSMSTHFPIVLLGRYMPSIGDSGLTGNPEQKVDADSALRGAQVYGDPQFDRIAHLLNDADSAGLYGDIFSPDANAVPGRVEAAVETDGLYTPGSVLEPSYGFAALRQGTRAGNGRPDTRRAATLYFGRNSFETGSSHCHANVLDLGIYADDLALSPDLGYPEHTGDWPKHDWVKGTVSHNTVVVDGQSQAPVRVGEPRLFEDSGTVAVVDVDAPDAFDVTDEYRRTTALVQIDETSSYVADVFRVSGGEEHVFSFHGGEGTVTTEGLGLVPRRGTYAGRDVPLPGHGERTAYNRDVGNGFNYLDDVARDDDPADQFIVDWDVVDTWDVRSDDAEDVHLRLTMLTDCDDVSLANGEPPRKGENPDSLRYLLARRTGSDVRSAFQSVIEPASGRSRIVGVTKPALESEGDVEAIRVELDTGRVDWIVSAGSPGVEYRVDERFSARGAFAFYAERDGEPVRAVLSDGTRLRSESIDEMLIERATPTALTGRVADFTRSLSQKNVVVVSPDAPVAFDDAVGRHLHVATEEGDNGVYEVKGVEPAGNDVIVEVGDATTIEGFGGDDFEYVLREGARARIPSSAQWTDDTGG